MATIGVRELRQRASEFLAPGRGRRILRGHRSRPAGDVVGAQDRLDVLPEPLELSQAGRPASDVLSRLRRAER